MIDQLIARLNKAKTIKEIMDIAEEASVCKWDRIKSMRFHKAMNKKTAVIISQMGV